MLSSFATFLLGVLLLEPQFGSAQQASSTSLTATVTSTFASTSATATTEPCAQVSELLASYASASPSAEAALWLPAQLAYDCSRSAPIVKEDALKLVTGLTAFLQWQSTLAVSPSNTYLKDPPEGYLLPGVDLLGGMQDLFDQVKADAFTSEIDFQTNLTGLIGNAQDGHLAFISDAMGVFTYIRGGLGQLVSVSLDGVKIPQVWSYGDLLQYKSGSAEFIPSPISTVDGQDAAEYFTQYAMNAPLGYQDPDALYNALFYEIAAENKGSGSSYRAPGTYTGPSVTVGFQNGTIYNYENAAITTSDFTGVDSGAAFYQVFCNATYKAAAAASASASALQGKRNVAAATASGPASSSSAPVPTDYNPRQGYPSPIVQSSEGNVAGYFLNGTGYERTAVLSVTAESESNPLGVQAAVSEFLAACTKASMKKLILDFSSNPGGDFMLAYDFFKQLFPTIDPYGAANLRATQEFNVLGSYITPYDQARRQNLIEYENDLGYDFFDALSYLDADNRDFSSWEDFFGPQHIHGDNFTYISRLNLSDANSDAHFGVVVSGYGNMTDIPPQPFASEDIVFFTDGQCSSSCPLFGHFVKYQGKVKQVAAGGRPQMGPMTTLGGTKGTNVYPLRNLQNLLEGFYGQAPASAITAANQTSLATLAGLADYIYLRTTDSTNADLVSVNVKNGIAEGDASQTPLQFVYDAADCRIWWTGDMLFDVTAIWKKVADVAFGVNGSAPFANGCVAGSTNQNSSLSGNRTLEGDGQPVNVTISPDIAGLDPSPSSASATRTATGTVTGSAGVQTRTAGAVAMGGRGAGACALVVAAGLGVWSIG